MKTLDKIGYSILKPIFDFCFQKPSRTVITLIIMVPFVGFLMSCFFNLFFTFFGLLASI